VTPAGNLFGGHVLARPVLDKEDRTMAEKKTLAQREKELQTLLATPAGRAEIQELEDRYYTAGARMRPARSSVITYLLVYEREQGFLTT
jgi:hypothetical protein